MSIPTLPGMRQSQKIPNLQRALAGSAPITAPTQTVHVLGNGPRGVEEGSSLRPVRMRVSGGQWALPAKGEAKSSRVTNRSIGVLTTYCSSIYLVLYSRVKKVEKKAFMAG